MKDSIRLSEKHGVNPSLLCCFVCGKEIGVALLGKLSNDKEAPKKIANGELCDDCKEKIKNGYVAVVEVPDVEPNKKTLNIKDVKVSSRSVFVRKHFFTDKVDTSKGILFCDKEAMDFFVSKNKEIEDSEMKKDE